MKFNRLRLENALIIVIERLKGKFFNFEWVKEVLTIDLILMVFK
jgi:hypothetical protein